MKKDVADLKALVWGGGSIGTRHATNLRSIGLKHIDILEADPARADALQKLEFSVVSETKKVTYDLAIVATPTHMHGEHAAAILQRGIPLFVEKPLAHDWKALERIANNHKKNPVVSLVGCNMRFHPGPATVKAQIERGAIGKVLFGNIYTGSYLPDWRPTIDYRSSYSASAAKGGGVLLDCIHEIDLAAWYFGAFSKVFNFAAKLSDLQIDCEDYAILVSEHSSGTMSEVHLDYFQRAYKRGCHIAGSQGTLSWDFAEPNVRLFNAETKSWTAFPLPSAWQMNDMYVAEMRHFINCVLGTESPTLDIPAAVGITEVAIQAREQSQPKKKRRAA